MAVFMFRVTAFSERNLDEREDVLQDALGGFGGTLRERDAAVNHHAMGEQRDGETLDVVRTA